MNAGRLAWRSLRQHALSTTVTTLSIALAGGLLFAVWMIKVQSRDTFTRMDGGFDAVLGVRSSKLQLILNAVFHLEASPGNLAWDDYLTIRKDPGVALAAPLSLGDNFRGYRLAGTITNFFTDIEFAPRHRHQLAAGRLFEPGYREAVVGSFVAQRLGLKVGDQFEPYHGLNFNPAEKHDETYVVVGVLKPSNTPADRVIWIPLEGIQNMSGHDPNLSSELSAVLVKFHPGAAQAGFRLDQTYNKKGNRLTFAWPIGVTVAQLLDKVGWLEKVLQWVALLVALIATGSVLAGVYNSINERRREFALLRALGARRLTVFAIVILEAVFIATIGMLLAYGVYGIIFGVSASVIRAETGVALPIWVWNPVFVVAPLAMITLSALLGLVPAVKAYRTDVAENLSPLS